MIRDVLPSAALAQQISPYETSTPPAIAEAAAAVEPPKEVFVSYAWTEESTAVVDKIEKVLTDRGITLFRDRNEIMYKDSTCAFMQRIGRCKAIVVVHSSRYLESKSCMFELTEIAKLGDIRKRIFPIPLPDADIHEAIGRVHYLRHWEDTRNELDAAMKTISSEYQQGIREDIDLYANIRSTIVAILNILGNMNALSLEKHLATQFVDLIEALG